MVQINGDSSLYNISNQINWRRSQISILYIKFPVFFHWKAIHETPMMVSIKVRESLELFLECQSRIPITFMRIFSGEDRLWFFWQKGNIIFVTFIHIYRKHHISMYFLRKIIFHFSSEEKISYFRVKKKYHFSR